MDGQTSNSSMDTSPSRSCDSSPNFVSLARSPHEVVSLLPSPPAHLLHEMPALFPNGGDPPNVLSDSMQVSIPDLPVNMSMDVLRSPSRPLGPAPGFISDFQQQCDSFGMSAGLDSDMGMDSSTPDSRDPSSSIHPITSGYSVGTSSLAIALDNMGVSMGRSRAGSTASPGKLMTSIPPIGYPPVNGSLATVDPSGVPFPPTDYSTVLNAPHENSPEVGNDPQPINVGHVLGSIAGYSAGLAGAAHSAREAYFVGQRAEVNVRIDELKRAFSFVSDLISKMDASLSFSEPSPIRHSTVSSATTPNAQATSSLLGLTPPSMEAHAMDVQTNQDVLDVSRKRCASSMAGGSADRVIKAPKMEPPDDDTLTVAASPTKLLPLSTPLMFTPSAVSVPATVNRSLPPSAPTSRPPTPGGMGVNLPQQPAHILPLPAQPLDFDLPTTIPSQSSAPPFPVGTRNRSSWSETPATLPHRHHQHSLSATSLNTAVNLHGLTMVPSSSTQPFTTAGTFGTPSVPGLSKQRPAANVGTTISPPLGRITRSGSMTTPSVNPISFGFADLPSLDSYDFMPSGSVSAPQRVSPESDEDEETEDDTGDSQQKGSSHSHSSPESGISGGHGNEVPQEYRAEVDRIFFEFLNKICSNLDASDSKGEPIHQTLMAKKMQRLDESPDFRPFKFRIAAFTNAFLEELARQGYPEEKIPMKKIRNYLWRQEYIQRFNEDGKKAKSKGNHIWNIDAKKGRDGGWVFRPFHRRLAGSPPGIAYVGLKWSWTPRIWDPQAASSHLPVHYSSPVLPHWLSWKEDVLSGIPPADADGCDITAEARFVRDGQEEQLSLTFHLGIAPISTLDTSFSAQRRPSLAGLHNPRRVQSDSVVPQVAPRSLLRQNPASQQTSATSQGAQVMQVLTSAAQRVAQEAQSQVIASLSPSSEPPGHELQALAKQQHVLTMTAAAFDKEYTGHRQDGAPQSPSSVLAAAAHQVVLQAARSVRADRSAASPPVTTSPVTVNEVSVATQSAVAQAVEITGPLSSEVDVLITATSLLQHHRAPVDSPQVIVPTESTGHLSTAVPPRNHPLTGINGSVSYPLSLPPLGLPEYAAPS